MNATFYVIFHIKFEKGQKFIMAFMFFFVDFDGRMVVLFEDAIDATYLVDY